jgi:hypothetical protein
MTQVCLYESLIFSKSASLWYQRQFNSSLPCPFLCCQAWNHCLPKLKLLPFTPPPLTCFMLSSQELFTNIPSMSWPWDTRSSWRSIFLELFPLSFSAVEQQFWRKEMKLHDVVDQPLQEIRLSSWDQQDRWRLVCPCFPSLLYYLRISGRDSCKGDRSVTSLF